MFSRLAARSSRASVVLACAFASGAFAQPPAAPLPAPIPPAPAAPTATTSANPTAIRLELLRDRWTSSAENREQAPLLYAALKGGGSYVAADDFLYGLVRFKHNQYDEAEGAIDQALERDPKDLMFLKARVWVALTRKRYDQALSALTKFQEALFAEGKASRRPAAVRTDDLRFLGQVHAYLAAAAERVTTQEGFEKLRDEVAKALALEDLRTFETAEREALARHEILVAEKEAAVAEFAEAADEAAAEKLAEIDERRRQLQERRVDIDGQRTTAVETAKAEVGNLAAAQLQARQAVAVLTNQLGPGRQQYSRQLEAIERTRRSLIAVPWQNLGVQQVLQAELQAAQQQAAAMESQLQVAERNFAQASSTLINVSRERAVKETAHARNVNDLERAIRQIDDDMKKLDKEEAALDKGAGTTVAIRQMSQKIGALGSYVEYDLEIPRLKLIEYLERR
ncbi:MAG TPA: hypothetical protein VGN57_06010 [Pirellulaceae bacterium]|jgi:hypothetical protein|nr:hypothetical protein [Pirellulaceae bacterium]